MNNMKPLKRLAAKAFKPTGHYPDSAFCSYANIWGDHVGMWGDYTGIHGNCSGVVGNGTGLRGDCSGISGNLDDIPVSERAEHPDLSYWVDPTSTR